MPADLASAAAGVTAGWTKTQLDRGAATNARCITREAFCRLVRAERQKLQALHAAKTARGEAPAFD